jgi:polysaccharide biosynthesis protein PelG
MAGIGFVLRKLTARDDLMGSARAYSHSVFATSGPWLFTVVSLGLILLLGSSFGSPQELLQFRLIVVCNFAFTLVMTGPIVMVTTRHLADCIHDREVGQIPAVLFGAMILAYGTQFFVAVPFYFHFLSVDPAIRLAGLLNYALIAGIWIVSVFLTALKNYRAISTAFLAGLTVAVVASAVLTPYYSVTGMFAGFDIGLAIILFALIARVLAEYPYKANRPFEILAPFRRYWDLALCGLAYNLAIWIDKWVMWAAPEHERARAGLFSCPDYESAMFLAYLTVVPAMAAFTLRIETDFFEKYLRFYKDIQRHANYARIERNQQELLKPLLGGARTFLVLQGGVAFTGILFAPRLFEFLHAHLGQNFGELAIFRLGLLGVFFHAGFLFLTIALCYFDLRKSVLALYSLFFVTNLVFTWASMKMGFAYYGYGYFLSALVTFVAAFLVTAWYLNRLPYITFVARNTSVA